MRRLCLFSGGLALAAALYVYAVHAAPWPLLLGLAALCGGLFLLRKAGTRRAAVCVLGLLTGFAWCRGYEALFLRPLERYAGQELPFAAEALAAPGQQDHGATGLHGRQRVAPQRLPDDQRVGDVIQLLQQISRDHRQRKQQQPPDDASLRQIPIHVLPFQFPRVYLKTPNVTGSEKFLR